MAAEKNHYSPDIKNRPKSELDRRELLDYLECSRVEQWHEPPISLDGLACTFRAATHHSSAIYVKRNILTSTFIPYKLLSQQAFSRFALDYLVFGNAYLEKRRNRLGGTLTLEPTLAKYMRRGVDLDTLRSRSFFFHADPCITSCLTHDEKTNIT